MENKYLQKLIMMLACMNLVHATSESAQIVQQKDALYEIRIRSVGGEIKETLYVSKAELADLQASLAAKYNKNTEPYDYRFRDPEIKDDKVEMTYEKKLRPYRVTKTKDAIEIFLVDQLLNDQVSVRMQNMTGEVANDTYYSTPDEFSLLFAGRSRFGFDPYVYVNQKEVGDFNRFGDFYKLRETILLAQEIAGRTDRTVADIVATLINLSLGHPFLKSLANAYSICKHSDTEYSVNYMKYKDLVLEIRFTDQSGVVKNWYKPEYEEIQRIQDLDLPMWQDAKIQSIKILDKEFILPTAISFSRLYALIENGLLRHLNRIERKDLVAFYKNIFTGFVFPLEQ